MSPCNKKDSLTYENDIDAHRHFMKNSRLLIQSTKNKMDRMQAMSEELNYLSSLIQDDRKPPKHTSITCNDQQRKDKLIPPQQKDRKSLNKTTVPGHIVVEKPKKKDTLPKACRKFKKLSDGGRLKIIESALEKVKEADARGKGKMTSETVEGATGHGQVRHHKIVLPRDKIYEGKTGKTTKPEKPERKESPRRGDVHTCLCECDRNDVIVDDLTDKPTTKGKGRTKNRFNGHVSRHSCVDHLTSYQGPVVLDGEDTAYSHLPALHINNFNMATPRPRLTIDLSCKDTIQMVKDSNLIHACLNKNDIGQAERFRNKTWWNHRCTCVQEYIRHNDQLESRRKTLKPNKITLQTTGFSTILSSPHYVPYEELSIGYRLSIGGNASIPISIRHLRRVRTKSKRQT